jgi:thiol-disulfide isomerase/thioredoxin
MRASRSLMPLLLVLGASLPLARAADDTARTAPGAGDLPPPALGVTLDGTELSTGKFAGKVLVVTFWASWCGPCKKELPMLEGLQRAGGKDHIQVVAINIEDRDTFRRLARGLSSLTLTLSHDYGKPSEAYGVHGIPHMVIIGRDGRIIAVHRGYAEDALDGLLAEINKALGAT